MVGKTILKSVGIFFASLLAIILILFGYFNLPGPAPREDMKLGMTFSARYATDLGLDWRATYLALLDDVGVKKLRLPVYWDLVEKENRKLDFSDLDWQLKEAKKRNVEVILVIGQKVPRWPECHIPLWVDPADDAKRKQDLLRFMIKTVQHYSGDSTVIKWQVENEPFLPFGVCPKFDVTFLEQEIALVRALDPTRPVLLTDSGELSLWYGAASRGDEFGTTLYRDIYSQKIGGYVTYPIGPNFFRAKEWLVRTFTNQQKLSVIELQAEPWASGWVADAPLSEQFRTMNEMKLRENVRYAEQVGFSEAYLWGGEWWYWMKTKKESGAMWQTGKELFYNHAK